MITQNSFSFVRPNEMLFCLEMANNHQGSVEHGMNIIAEFAAVARRTQARVMVKLQFRELQSFLHPADRSPANGNGQAGLSGHTKRFKETALTKEQFGQLIACARGYDLPIYATPFDEASVDLCVDFGFDVIKVGSCSAYDWPLLRKIATTKLPAIVSLGGLTLNETDDVVDFFGSGGTPLALMHCVSTYPTAIDDLQLDNIRQLKERYPHLTIGYSGHESPQALDVAALAVAKGAAILERHVGLPTDSVKLNAYSLSPQETEQWIESAKRGMTACANGKIRRPVAGETESLTALKRGIYARRTIPAGKTVTADDVFLAMPCLEGQFHAGKYYEVVDSFTPMQPIYANMPIGLDLPEKLPKAVLITSIMARIKEALDEAKIKLDRNVEVELSHQYGFDRFFDIGAVIIDVVNRDYCKKLLIQFPHQAHPSHRHIEKEETFQVLSGTVDVLVNEKKSRLYAGEKQLVERGTFHSFSTETGVIFEEVSTTSIKGDSEYEDTSIPSDPTTRKTKIDLLV
jgi:sialic acid synthase SpsE/mannose-6-phosphate isomerase-like protein (cupin superfamily)